MSIRRRPSLPWAGALGLLVCAATAEAQTFADVTVPASGGNLELRLWAPDGVAKLRGLVIWVHGNYGDDRWVANASGGDAALQLLAQRHAFGLIGVHFTSNFPNYDGGLRDITPMETGITLLATTYAHPELTTAPIAIAGMSGGSGYAINFANYRPGRTIAFAHNKGGSYQQLSDYYGVDGAWTIPGVVCYGGNDVDAANPLGENDRAVRIKNTFRKDRAGGALWCLLPDFGLGHDAFGYGRYFGALFLDRMIERRIPAAWLPGTAPTLLPVDAATGWLGDNGLTWAPIVSGTVPRDVTPSTPVDITPVATASAALLARQGTLSWLPDEELARAWRAVATTPTLTTLQAPRTSGGLNTAHWVTSGAGVVRPLTLASTTGLGAVTWYEGLTALATPASPFSASHTDAYGIQPIWAALTAVGTTTARTSDLTVLGTARGANQAPKITTPPAFSAARPTAGVAATLRVRASDPDGGLDRLLTTTWQVLSGPGTATFAADNGSAVAQDCLTTFPTPGDWVVQVRVADAEGLSATATLTLTVRPPFNEAPVVAIAPASVPALLPLTTTLVGTVSDDDLPVGAAVTATWSQVSGPGAAVLATPDRPTTAVTFPTAGTYVLRLEANDSALTGSATVTVDVPPPVNQAPVVGVRPTLVLDAPGTVALAGSVSDDGLPSGSLAVQWTVVSGAATFVDAALPTTSATFPQDGDTVIALSADDGALATTAQLRVRVNAAPVVTLASPFTAALPGQPVVTASATDDGLPGGTLTYAWSLVAGPGPLTFRNPSALTSGCDVTVAGSYTVRLTVSDGRRSSSADTTVIVTPANRAPVVDAPSDVILDGPGSATLVALISDDGLPLGNRLGVRWSQRSGPAATITAPNQATTAAVLATPGTYVFTVVVDDGVLSTTALRTIRVNAPPTVSAGTDRVVTLPATLALAGTASDDGLPGRTALTTTWTLVDGPGTVTFLPAGSPLTTATFSSPGVYQVRLRGDDGATAIVATVQVTVFPDPATNHAPQVSAAATATIRLADTLALNGQVGDVDPIPGVPLRAWWTQVAGPAPASFADTNVVTTTARFPVPGRYTVRLSASDGQQAAATDLTIEVLAADAQPVASDPGGGCGGGGLTAVLLLATLHARRRRS